ncbi:hypothetical protein ACJX0J_025093, partial [Zea mays]
MIYRQDQSDIFWIYLIYNFCYAPRREVDNICTCFIICARLSAFDVMVYDIHG